MTSLAERDLRIVYKTLLRAEQVHLNGVRELSDLFAENPRLIISPNNKCAGHCLHCVADSTPSGDAMSYDDFARIDSRFFKIFSAADFGRRGNPLLYRSNGHDLTNLLELLAEYGINHFTLALALQSYFVPVLERLEEFAASRTADIETMVTYHHYHQDLDVDQLAKDVNSTLKNYMGFSRRIKISLLGDMYSQQNPTKAEEVQMTFHDKWDVIFRDIDMTLHEDSNKTRFKTYDAQFGSKEAEIQITQTDTRVYPLGRFRQYLIHRGLLEQYEKQFEEARSDYVCPDLIKWPGIIIEPDGSLNLCSSFEAITCRKATVSNIFTKDYIQVEDELMQFHQRERRWFIDNLPDIIAGNVSTCKFKNNCYQ